MVPHGIGTFQLQHSEQSVTLLKLEFSLPAVILKVAGLTRALFLANQIVRAARQLQNLSKKTLACATICHHVLK
jgi:hypothetical protein